ncbi:sigma-54 interaction domain-containing protein [Thioalkalivibrio sulfidiphilus]|uniref:sigma-54 interaction domain-containing protein n=1 Tax=Thioalkalivibrio sulfidiphilus TaxID=1033854 RepID=UPI0005705985|nr:sigma 54-interacting transcriptional regulator [Thioalkalivibrio sulfidiphilus]
MHAITEAGNTPAAASEDPQRDQEITVFLEMAKLIGRSLDTENAIHRILGLLSQLLGLNRGRVLLPDPVSGKLIIRHAYGLTESEIARGHYNLGEGVTGRVFKTGQVALIQDIDNEPEYLARAVDRSTLPQETVAYIAVPIQRDRQVVGVLAVHRLRRRQRSFHADLDVLRVVAATIGQILHINTLVAERTAELVTENRYLKNVLDTQGSVYGVLGESSAIRHVLKQAHRVADTQATVLITGESGTGKEKLARMVHMASQRRDMPFVCINCAAIPESLLESELFGHEKGAFTGASHAKPGKIAQADGGTLFLDEIGDMPLELQSKLLRVLQERTIQPIGGMKEIPVDVRIITATHQNLQDAVNQGRFRLDLFYRLNVIPLHLPALRDRAGDARLLARYFLSRFNHRHGCSVVFGDGALERIEAFDWPGNVRQLENVIERAVLTCMDGVIDGAVMDTILNSESRVVRSAFEPTHEPARSDTGPRAQSVRPYLPVHENEADRILEALKRCAGNKTRAALSLGLTPRQLRYRIQKLEL